MAVKTGREVTFPRLAELADGWAAIPRRKAPDERYALQCRLRLERFAKSLAEHPGRRHRIHRREASHRPGAGVDAETQHSCTATSSFA